MNSCETLHQNCLYAQIQRSEGCVFSGRTLSIVRATNDDALAHFLGSGRECFITNCEAMLRDCRNIRPQRQNLCTSRHDVVGGDIIANLQRAASGNGCFQRSSFRERLDVWPSQDFYAVHFFCRYWLYNHVIMNLELFRQGKGRHFAQFSWVAQVTSQCRISSQFRRNQINLSILCSRPSEEVPVEGSQGDTAGVRGLSHTDARAAGTFQNSCTCINHNFQQAQFCHHGQNLLGTRCN